IDLSRLGGLVWNGTAGPQVGVNAVWYTTDGAGGSFVYADTNGDGTADLKIQVSNVPTLSQTDFILASANNTPTIVAGSTTATGAFGERVATTGSTSSDSAVGSIAFTDADLSDRSE